MRVAWLFLAWMLVEIGLFAAVGGRIGVLATWAEVLGSALAGIWLIRRQKLALVTRAFQDLRSLGAALEPAAHSALIALAGVLLFLPGFLTDALGLVLLLPWVRGWIIGYVRARTRVDIMTQDLGHGASRRPADADVIDAVAIEVASAEAKPSGWTKA